MALWQFISLSVPIGGLLVYVGVLTTRVGLANIRLKKIEEVLEARERGSVQVNVASGEVARPGTSSEDSNGHVNYQTIRDLRAKQSLPTSPATSEVSSPTHSTSTAAQDTSPVQVTREMHRSRQANGGARKTPAAHLTGEVYVPPYLRIRVAPDLAGDLEVASEPGREIPVTTAAEAPASISVPDIAAEAVVETFHALVVEEVAILMPAFSAAATDALAKKKNDVLVFLSNQRRRRRTQRA